jgi:hypothetical protein
MEIDLAKVAAALKEDRAKIERVEEAFRIVAEYQRERLGLASAEFAPAVTSSNLLAPEFTSVSALAGKSKTDMVKEAVQDCPAEFDLNDVMVVVAAKKFPMTRADVSFELSRLAKASYYRTVEAGSGKRATIYGKIAPVTRTRPEEQEGGLDALLEAAKRDNPDAPEFPSLPE